MTKSPKKPSRIDAFCTSGTSPGSIQDLATPTIHLIGPGAVGRALLEQLGDLPFRLVAVTDRSATLIDPLGLDPLSVARAKHRRGALSHCPGALAITTEQAIERADAGFVIDCTPTAFTAEAEHRAQLVLDRGRTLVVAAKDVLAAAAPRWARATRVGFNAALGGTGGRLQAELDELRAQWTEAVVVGNATTTTIIEAIEMGATVEEGIRLADARGLLEADPEADLTGADAATKLAVVAGALGGAPIRPETIARVDVRALDATEIRARRTAGRTTRLVGRANRDGELRLAFESVDPHGELAVPADRVAYVYALNDGTKRLHVGDGIGPAATARAALADLIRLADVPAPSERSLSANLDQSARVAHLPADFRLELGGPLGCGVVAFEDHGDVGKPVVVIQGGISAGRTVFSADAERKPGWWEPIVGPGRAIDTNDYRVISFDYLGGAGESTGPQRDESGRLRSVTTADQARALLHVLDALEIESLHAYVGASYGGMVGLALGTLAPERVGRIVAISAPHQSHPLATAWRSLQRKIVRLGLKHDDPEALALARGLAMTTYRTADEFAARFPADWTLEAGGPRFPVEDYLDYCGRQFRNRFRADALLVLSESIDLHRVEPSSLRVPLHLVGIPTDTLVPLWQLQALVDSAGGPAELRVVESLYGHDAFLKEIAAIGAVLRATIAAPPTKTPSRNWTRCSTEVAR